MHLSEITLSGPMEFRAVIEENYSFGRKVKGQDMNYVVVYLDWNCVVYLD